MVQGSLTSFGDYQYAQEAIRIISEHDTDVPMFFYVAFQCNHLPLEAPDSFIEMCKTPPVFSQNNRVASHLILRGWCVQTRTLGATIGDGMLP